MAQRVKYHQSLFTPKNPGKYAGRVDRIFARSGWERQLMHALDENPDILKWSSEEVYVPYRDPVTGDVKRYYPDFLTKAKQKEGGEKVYLIEVKPDKETRPPRKGKKASSNKYATLTYMRNQAKWEAAKKYAESRGWQFLVITEKNMRFLQ